MKLADSRQGYGWVSIAFHWLVAALTFYLFYGGLGLQEEEGPRGVFGRGAGEAGDRVRQFGEGARQLGAGFANAGRQFAENAFAPRALHISIGVIAVLFIAGRMLWRVFQGAPPKGNESPVLNLIATVVQWGLLAALLVLAVSGPLLVWEMGQPISVFNWFTIPSPLPSLLRDLRSIVGPAHTLAAYSLVPLVGLHILGALKHAIIDRDGVLRRIFVPTRA
jgi:cytochrome b561